MIVLALCITAAFLVGTLAGAVALARWYVWRIRKPEVISEILQNAYRASHPHWLQHAPDDPSRVCPCCGWEEHPLAPIGPGDRCGIRIIQISWAALEGGPDLVGARKQIDEVAVRWRAENVQDGVSQDFLDYAVRPYSGTDPARAEDVEAYLRRETTTAKEPDELSRRTR